MAPRLVVCECCGCGCRALAVCDECERRELHRLLIRRGAVQDNYVAASFAALVESYERSGT